MKNRSSSVDIIRVLATLIVIGCHITIPPLGLNNTIDLSRIIITAAVGSGVSIFFIVAGFFMFRDKPYKEKIKNAIKTIYLPMLITIIVTQFLSRYIKGETGIIDSIIHNQINIKRIIDILRFIIGFNFGKINLVPHFWYLSEYAIALLWIPVLSLIIKSDKKYIKYMVYIIYIIYAIFDSFKGFTQNPIRFPSIISTSLFLILLGNEIYSRKDKIINNKKVRCISFALAIIAFISQVILQRYLFTIDVTKMQFINWSCVPAIIFSSSLIIFILSFNIKSNKVITYLGMNSFYVYLIHFQVKEKLSSMGIRDRIFYKLNELRQGFVSEALFTFIMALLVFVICIFIISILKLIIKLFKYLIKKIKK